MKTIIFTLIIICTCCITNAQNLIAVEHNGVSAFYTTLDDAANAAQTGDNVYVPGGTFTLNVAISKGFNLIGVGYNPDSTIATGFTQITNPNGYITIVTGADNGSIRGVYFYNTSIYFGTSTSDQTVNNYSITRCRIVGLLALGFNSTSNTTSTNLIFNENIINDNIVGAEIQNCHFSNNIIGGGLFYFNQGNEFVNNIFLYSSSWILQYVVSSLFKNNIFLYTYSNYISTSSSNNTFDNNLFIGNFSGYLPGFDINSLYNVAQTKIFINQSGNAYNYHQDYHLKTTCPGHNYGTDGTDLGVYGTATPWKEGGVPYNPHIQFQSIATQTDGNGNLNVNIKVAAQKN